MLGDADIVQIGSALEAVVDAALHCLAALPQQTALILQRSPSASEAWALLSRCGQERALLLAAWNEDIEEELDSMALQAEERESGAAARLQQCMQRLNLLRALTKDHEERHSELQDEELRRRLMRAEAALREREEASAQRVAALEQQVRHLQGLLVEGEEQLLALRQSAARGDVLASGDALKDVATGDQHGGTRNSSDSSQSITADAKAFDATALKPLKRSRNKLSQPDGHGSKTHEEEVLEAIRSDRMVGTDPSQLPERFRSSVAEMRESLTAAVDRLARDLYESEAHFLQELLQNADDNTYSPGVIPSVQFTLRAEKRAADTSEFEAYFYAANNEVGLTEKDVRALCDISRSSKSLSKGKTTGYKGVGWKSVFCVSDTPHVLSQGWRFKFSAKGLGMLTPESLSDAEYLALPLEVREAHQAGNTVFFLPLSTPKCVASIEGEMALMESDVAQLLFLRRLREIHLKGHCKEEACVSVLGDEDLRKATLSLRKSVESESAAAAEERVETHFEVCRQGDVTVAVPLEDEPPSQRVFAFLPVRCVGFRFAVHAPFHLTASRTDLHRSLINTQFRNAIAPAFLSACQANEDVAVSALKFLGTEPTEVFWLPVRTAILSGLQGIACIMTESGCAAPEGCVLRGEDPAMHWLPESLLQEACGLSFATTANPREVLRDLGIRKCDFSELVACISHEDGNWLKSMWRSPDRGTIFSDIYASLAEALLAEPDRLEQMEDLKIFPAATERPGGSYNRNASLLNEADVLSCKYRHKTHFLASKVTLVAAQGLYSAFCDAVPREWQVPLLQCISSELELSPNGRKLLALLGVEQVTEAELERVALRQAVHDQADQRHCFKSLDVKVIWSALAILRRCFLLGHTPPQPWAEVRNAITLPSASGQFLAPCLLKPWSFIGVQMKIPKGLRQSIYEFAGINILSSEMSGFESVAVPSMEPPADQSSATWHFGWEVFLCILGCKPVDPTGQFGECCLEAILQVGDVLVSGQFWQQVSQSRPAKAYLDSVLGRGASASRLPWLRRLPATLPGGNMVAVEDFFSHDVFHRLAGSHLPYVAGVPEDADVHRLLWRLGIAVEMNRSTLLKCIRFLRAQNVQDIGLAADIYLHLGQMGQQGLGREELLLVPGRGYLRQEDCCWRPFHMPLLQRCNRLQVLVEHYNRFGVDVADTLCQWVPHGAELNTQVLCETLSQAVACAKADASRPHRPHGNAAVLPEEARANLLAAAQQVVGFLACACAREASAAGVHMDAAESSHIAHAYFFRQRMIVVPDQLPALGGRQRAGPRLLSLAEAYWSVGPELQQDPSASWALQAHYSNLPNASTEIVQEFFVKCLGVQPIFRPPLHQLPVLPAPTPALSPSGSNDSGQVSEGLHCARVLVARNQSESQQAAPPPGVNRLAQLAIQRAQFHIPPSDRSQQNPGNRGPELQSGSGAAGSSAAPCAASSPDFGLQPPQNSSTRREWRLAGHIDGFKLFIRDGASPPEGHAAPDCGQLRRLCAACGLGRGQVSLAYDPTGQCVCQEHLFLDLSRTQVAASLPNPAATLVFWVSELAHAVAHQGMSGRSSEGEHGRGNALMQLQNEVLAWLLPAAYWSEMQYWNGVRG